MCKQCTFIAACLVYTGSPKIGNFIYVLEIHEKSYNDTLFIGLTIGLTEGLHTRAFKSHTLAEKQDMGLLKHTYMYKR